MRTLRKLVFAEYQIKLNGKSLIPEPKTYQIKNIQQQTLFEPEK